jgi:putative ABC transport system substrate-binding protein
MRRREFIKLAVGAAAAWPLVASAQQPAMPVIGFLDGGALNETLIAAFRGGLGEMGFVEGRNVVIEFRFAGGHYDSLPTLAADLVARQVAVIAVVGIAGALAAKAATSQIPIIFATGEDPVQLGLVSSLNRPDGNVTGVFVLINTLVPKQLELLFELVPTTTLVGCLVNPTSPNAETDTRTVKLAAGITHQQILILHASNESEIDNAFATLAQQHVGSLLVEPDPFLFIQRDKIITLAARYALPAIYGVREFAMAGGLMSYGTDLVDPFRQLGVYAGKILKGAKPADLPVQQSVKAPLVINLRTAKALGITVPLPLLGRADEVIE